MLACAQFNRGRNRRKLRYEVILFDIDGTLVDSATDICGAVQTVLQSLPQPETYPNGVPFAFLKSYIGRHLQDLFIHLYPAATQAEIDAWIAQYRQIYLGRGHAHTTLYPGVAETMPLLPGRKSTATTKGTPTTTAVLEKFGLRHYFHHIQGTDGFPAKPKPDVILKALEGLRADPARTLFVGDSAPDMEAGRAAGVHLCAAVYGYGKAADLAMYRPEYTIESFAQLATFLKS